MIATFLQRFWSHIFVISTGFAALMHSTWTLSTMFGGNEPVQFSQAWWAWLIPGFAIAFSFDVGQIAISVDLRKGERSRAKYVAFAVVAIATYYLQWLYMAAHIPLIPFGAGVALGSVPAASFLRDFAIWIIPGLLPLATTLYTFSYEKPKRTPVQSPRATVTAKPSESPAIAERPQLAHPTLAALPAPVDMTAMFMATCEKCGWSKPCATERSKINSLNAHMAHCPANVEAR